MIEGIISYLALFTVILFLFSCISRRIEATPITAPMVFLTAGLLLGPAGADIISFQTESGFILLIAEIALVFTLFSDASRIGMRGVKDSGTLPPRLLGIGLPLTILTGLIAAIVVFPGLGFVGAGILATLLAPTDAALGEAIVTNRKVPLRIRQALNVEAGLNDGAVIPVLTILVTITIVGAEAYSAGYWIVSAAVQIILAVCVGIAVGLAGGWIIDRAEEKRWMEGTYTWISLMALAITAWILADILGSSGFIAAFIAGLAIGTRHQRLITTLVDFTTAQGRILGHLVFFTLGVGSSLLVDHFSMRIAAYAVLSLTIIRFLPVAIAMIGTGLKRNTVLFLGWFGPRGLASIVLLFTVMEEMEGYPGMETITAAAITTVILSVFAHGMSTGPGIARYSRHAETFREDSPEYEAVLELPAKLGRDLSEIFGDVVRLGNKREKD